MSSLPVFFAERLPCVGGVTTLDGPEGRHAATVRRLRVGEGLVLTDGCGELAVCEVLDAGRDRLQLTVLRRESQPAPDLRVTLAQALVKGPRGELSVELATEAGVDAVLPWRADRCVARWDDGPRGARALSRWRQTAQESAKQSRRGWFPEVAEPVDTTVLAERCAAAAGCLVLHESATDPLPTVALPAAGELLVVVGPEGGITDSELATLTAAGGRPVRLGSGVLRSSSAGTVALGAISALSQRWS
ncbi:MAG: 16S rRNA (uracil(1498)-N(3))-methyltransferase [Pseudonocardiales bacterium]|nr:16S rRNA (uracil(1498)-N(3))-methyltransferase [Actinomycetota bacterium]PZS15982.1 MAG: 16S rRNA (uracil(1498)-N(3))-methyltransferase [Pseudonocardiales bacterium]